MKKKVLFTATVDSHILQFHLPFLKLFKEQGYEVHVATNGDEKIPYCDKKYKVSFERSPIKINNLKAIKELRKVINEEKYEIIHTHTPMGSVVTRLAARKARRKYHTRVIYTAHGFHFYKGAPLKNWLIFYPVEKWLSKYTDTLITINGEDYNLAKTKFKKCKDIEYVPGVGIDEEKFNFKMTQKDKSELRKSLGLSDDDFVMIYPAELSNRKRQLWLINTISNLLKDNSNMHLLLPGKDSLNGKCQELTKELNLEKQIHFLGYRTDIPKLLKISDLAVSAANQEGLPVNIMEAMYVGLPIVASNCRGNRDLVKDGVNGYLIELDDNKRFTESCYKLYKKTNNSFSKSSKSLIKDYLLAVIMTNMIPIYHLDVLNDLVSVIVPIYNVEKFLPRCIDSIINQSYSNIEILLIDDGSTDNSGLICDGYLKKDDRIKVIHKNNGGLSDARNCGIKNAFGNYVTFIDSDDYISNDYVDVLYSIIKNTGADISIGIWKEVYDNKEKTVYRVFPKTIMFDSGENMLEKMFYQKLFDTTACAKLFKRDLFTDVSFPIGLLYEDLDTMYKLFLKANRVSYVNKEIYYYYKRSNSITNGKFKTKDIDLIDVSERMFAYISSYTSNNRLINAAMSRVVSSYFTIFMKVGNDGNNTLIKNQCIGKIRKYAKINCRARMKNNIAIVLFMINPQLLLTLKRGL